MLLGLDKELFGMYNNKKTKGDSEWKITSA